MIKQIALYYLKVILSNVHETTCRDVVILPIDNNKLSDIGVVNLASHRVFFSSLAEFFLIQSDWLIPKKSLEASGIEKPFHSLQVIFFN